MAREVKAKRKCCRSDPRCKRCPVVLKRLAKAGFAEQQSSRRYVVAKVPKKKMKKLRTR